MPAFATCPSGSAGSPISLNYVTYYASTSGHDDGNTCGSIANPCTLTGATEKAAKVNQSLLTPVVSLAAGTYTAGGAVAGAQQSAIANVATNQIYICGASGSGSTTIADATSAPATIIASDAVNLIVTGLTLTSAHGSLLFPTRNASIGIGADMVFGTAALGQLHAEQGGVVEAGGNNYTISGGAPAHFQTAVGGRIIYNEVNTTITLTGTPAFSTAFADIENNGVLYVPSANFTFMGAATGNRYLVNTNSTIETNSGSATYFPGNAAGKWASNGIYDPLPAPSVNTPTGLGTGGTASVVSGSSDRSFTIQLSSGTAATAASGAVNLAFAGIANNVSCVVNPTGNSWAAGPTAIGTSVSTTGLTVKWTNAATNLVISTNYFLSGKCEND